MSDPQEIEERQSRSDNKKLPHRFYRFRASTKSYSLSVRAADGLVEVFLVPADETLALSEAEFEERLKLRLKLEGEGESALWTLGGMPLEEDEARFVMKSLFRELVHRSVEPAELQRLPANLFDGHCLATALSELSDKQRNLARKIVFQQEQIQGRIARELHDAVISDVMTLKRLCLSDNKPSTDHLVSMLDRITKQLREICEDLTPKDLRDWGLQTVIENLLAGISERTGADCDLDADASLPEMPEELELNIYRIVQECLNNAEKYAQASRILVQTSMTDGALVISIQDNGKGMGSRQSKAERTDGGGCGMGTIRERVELIRCFNPANFRIESGPAGGTRCVLEIDFQKSGK